MVRPDPRTEPAEYAQYCVDAYRRHSARYALGLMSEAVYRASLYALKWRGRAIDTECRLNAPRDEPVTLARYRRRVEDKCDPANVCALDQPCSCLEWARAR